MADAPDPAIKHEVAKEEQPDPRRCLERAWNQRIVDRYEQQKTNPHYTMELHVDAPGLQDLHELGPVVVHVPGQALPDWK